MADLRIRWDEDAMELAPDLAHVLIGVHDTWRRHECGEETSVEAYEEDYRPVPVPVRVRVRVRDELDAWLVLIKPFLLPVTADRRTWQGDPESAAGRRTDEPGRTCGGFHRPRRP